MPFQYPDGNNPETERVCLCVYVCVCGVYLCLCVL